MQQTNSLERFFPTSSLKSEVADLGCTPTDNHYDSNEMLQIPCFHLLEV